MSRHSRNINLLDKINNIDEDCSEDYQEVYDIDDDTAENYFDLFDSSVDVTAQMAKKYSAKSKCQSWVLQVFFNILDLAGVNAWLLYKETTGEEISGQKFLFQLAEEIGAEYQKEKQISKECASKTIINTNTVSSECRSSQAASSGKAQAAHTLSGETADSDIFVFVRPIIVRLFWYLGEPEAFKDADPVPGPMIADKSPPLNRAITVLSFIINQLFNENSDVIIVNDEFSLDMTNYLPN
uniref:PiggyBac transposable element-derived protein domain-containing protein n=1 Tax=Glossina austeni TaxID=7395 RepID=A0A1A9V4M7_GLOAU